MASIRRVLLLAVAGLIPACGPTETAKALLTPETRREVQIAAASLNAVQRASQTVRDALIAGGNRGPAGAPRYPSDADLSVDLGTSVPGGLPRPSGMAGVVAVSARGKATGDEFTGESTYSVQATASTALTFLEPVSGVFARIPPGTTWTFSLRLQWTWTDLQNGSVIAEATESWSSFRMEAFRQAAMVDVTIEGLRSGTTECVWVSATLSVEETTTSEATVTWTDSAGPKIVQFRVDGPDAVLVTVGETTFGPLTGTQLMNIFRVLGI